MLSVYRTPVKAASNPCMRSSSLFIKFSSSIGSFYSSLLCNICAKLCKFPSNNNVIDLPLVLVISYIRAVFPLKSQYSWGQVDVHGFPPGTGKEDNFNPTQRGFKIKTKNSFPDKLITDHGVSELAWCRRKTL
jgi:hypothetical protein